MSVDVVLNKTRRFFYVCFLLLNACTDLQVATAQQQYDLHSQINTMHRGAWRRGGQAARCISSVALDQQSNSPAAVAAALLSALALHQTINTANTSLCEAPASDKGDQGVADDQGQHTTLSKLQQWLEANGADVSAVTLQPSSQARWAYYQICILPRTGILLVHTHALFNPQAAAAGQGVFAAQDGTSRLWHRWLLTPWRLVRRIWYVTTLSVLTPMHVHMMVACVHVLHSGCAHFLPPL